MMCSTRVLVLVTYSSTRNFLTFVNTTAIAYGQKPAAPADFLPICNSSRVYKRQKITSTIQILPPSEHYHTKSYSFQ